MTSTRAAGRIAWAFFLAAGLLLVIADTACPDELTWDVASLSLAAGADVASTHYALSRCPLCYERNPLMRSANAQIVLKAAGVAGTAWACDRLRKDGHKGLARVLRWTVVAGWSGLAVHNWRQADR
jgi:hypothetical protein